MRNHLAALALLVAAVGARAQSLPEGFYFESVGNFVNPVGLAFGPNGWLWVAEKRGKVWILRDYNRLPEPFIELDGPVNDNRDGGLLGIAVHPDFERNGYVYLLFVVDPDEMEPNATGEEVHTYARLERYVADPERGRLVADLESRTVLVGPESNSGFPVCHSSHMIGTLYFGSDGTLFAGSGDGAHFNGVDVGGRDPECFDPHMGPGFVADLDIGALRALHPDTLSGKVIRIDPETGLGLPSNPFFVPEAPNAHRSKVWVSGLRNPYRFTVRPGSGSGDPADGDPGTLYIGDVGWGTWEEVNVGRGGESFGWPCYEGVAQMGQYVNQAREACEAFAAGTNPYDDTLAAANTAPLLEIHHGDPARGGLGFIARAVGGSAFYEGGDYPRRYNGAFFQADYPTNWIRAMWVDEDDAFLRDDQDRPRIEAFMDNARQPIDLRADPVSGDLFYVSWADKQVRRIRHRDRNNAPFAVVRADPTEGPAPLAVQFDASDSFDLDEGDPVLFHWDFGDGETSDQAAPRHVYEVGGTYEVLLTLRDDRRGVTTHHLRVTAGNLAPRARILRPGDGTTYESPAEVVLAGIASDPEDLEDVHYAWSVTRQTADGDEPDWFAAEGPVAAFLADDPEQPRYRIHLTVTDRDGAEARAEVVIRPFSQDDADGDGVLNGADNCRDDANEDQADLDRDGRGDACDDDDDGDGVPDGEDDCPAKADEAQADQDEDGIGDACDPDADGDDVLDADDNCPGLANEGQADQDDDGLGDDCDPDDDGDGVVDGADDCPAAANRGQEDLDGDGQGDACDADDDGDGVDDDADNCPRVANEGQADQDGDTLGDACDDDVDGDGVPDAIDGCPEEAGEQVDTDRDGIGDACDPDDDNDGHPDGEDNCPLVANPGQANLDDDDLGDACDPDRDGDGIADDVDPCPDVAAEGDGHPDLDGDGRGDACDDDADGDGVANAVDNCPALNTLELADLDGDGAGDACDDDDDDDDAADDLDNCPKVPNEDQADADGDGVGDACDPTPLPPDPDMGPAVDPDMGPMEPDAGSRPDSAGAGPDSGGISGPDGEGPGADGASGADVGAPAPSGGGDGCECDTAPGSGPPGWWLLAVAGLRRRRR